MQFSIEKLVLWPVDSSKAMHILPFKHGKINIVHGRSGTGKSSIIAIIDYCLGAGKCAIPVGIIRDTVDWFGLQINVQGATFLIARRTPGIRQVSNEFYLKAIEDDMPAHLASTHNDQQFKQAFNNLVRLTNVSLGQQEDAGQFDGRPSYRDLAAFNFLPQHIVANPNTLFYKADSYEHKERLKKMMPFALGIISSEYVVKEKQRNQLQRQYDDLVKQQEIRRRSMTSWEAEVERLWLQSAELGIVQGEEAGTVEKKLSKLREVNLAFLAGDLDTILQSPSYAFTNKKYKEVQTAEEGYQAQVDVLRREIRGYERLAQRAMDFSGAVKQERSHVINLEWLKAHLGGENECVVCGSHTNQLHSVVTHLESEMGRVSDLSEALFESPIVDKEIERAKAQLFDIQGHLHKARMDRLQLQKIDTASKDSLSRVYVLMGRIQALLIAYAAINNSDEQAARIMEIANDIRDLDIYFRNSDKAARESNVDEALSKLIEGYAEGFKLEKRGKIFLDKNELTLSFRKSSETKKEFLWEVGSGANWMGYHIATFLALHEFLSEEKNFNSPAFSFLVIDQPSQVYFPSANSGANQLDGDSESLEKLKLERDVDISATQRIFEMLAVGLKNAKHQYQIIVLEHADRTIWGDVADVNEVANWKGEGQGLIPKAWH